MSVTDTIQCGCGCGAEISRRGLNGKPRRFIKNHDKRLLNRKGAAHPRWKGGVRITKGGHARVWVSPEDARDHPTAYKHGENGGWTMQRSHLIWNTAHPYDRVQPGEVIHHINHVRDDDRIDNLAKMDLVTHARQHGLGEI